MNNANATAAKIIVNTALETMAAQAKVHPSAILAQVMADPTGATARRFSDLIRIGKEAMSEAMAEMAAAA